MGPECHHKCLYKIEAKGVIEGGVRGRRIGLGRGNRTGREQVVHPRAWILGEGLKSEMRVLGWCLKIRTRKREMRREPPKPKSLRM